MSEHTEGPWEWSGDDIDGPDYAIVLERRVDCGTYCQGGTARLEISDADRRLIAAAPDLLAALERIVALGASDPERFRAEIGDADKQARAAIAKARALPPTAAVAPSAPTEAER